MLIFVLGFDKATKRFVPRGTMKKSFKKIWKFEKSFVPLYPQTRNTNKTIYYYYGKKF